MSVRPTLLVGLSAFVIFLAIQEVLVETPAWPLSDGVIPLLIVAGGMAVSFFGRRMSGRAAAVVLAVCLAALAFLTWPHALA